MICWPLTHSPIKKSLVFFVGNINSSICFYMAVTQVSYNKFSTCRVEGVPQMLLLMILFNLLHMEMFSKVEFVFFFFGNDIWCRDKYLSRFPFILIKSRSSLYSKYIYFCIACPSCYEILNKLQTHLRWHNSVILLKLHPQLERAERIWLLNRDESFFTTMRNDKSNNKTVTTTSFETR